MNLLFFISIFSFLFILSKEIKIFPINPTGNFTINTGKEKSIFFYTQIQNIYVGNTISFRYEFLYSKMEIFIHYNLSYTFTEEINYKNINEKDLIHLIFNSSEGKYDGNNLYKTIVKENHYQNGIILKLSLFQSNKTFQISRINSIILKNIEGNFQLKANSHIYYIIHKDNIPNNVNIFFFVSKCNGNFINYTFQSGSFIMEFSKCFLIINKNSKLNYIFIFTEKDIMIIIKNIQLGKIYKIFQESYSLNFCSNNSSFKEMYFLNNFEPEYFYVEKFYGDFEVFYYNLSEVENLDQIIPFSKNKWAKIFNIESILIIPDKVQILFYFKCENYSKLKFYSNLLNGNKEKIEYNKVNYVLITNNLKNLFFDYFHKEGSILELSYFNCKLHNGKFLYISLINNYVILNETIKNVILNDIEYRSYYHQINVSTNGPNCILKLNFGNKYNTINKYYINENNTKGDLVNIQKIGFYFPKINENNTYHIIFETEKEDNEKNVFYDNYINENNFLFLDDFDKHNYNYFNKFYIDITTNPYLYLSKDKKNFTYYILIDLPKRNHKLKIKKSKYLIIKNAIQNVNNGIFLLIKKNKFCEYILPQIKNETGILIQLLYIPNYITDLIITIGNYDYYYEKDKVIRVLKGDIPILKYYSSDLDNLIKVEYININSNYLKLNPNLIVNITLETFGIIKFKIKPYFEKELIEYTIHFIRCDSIKYCSNNYSIQQIQQILENFGNLSINITFTKQSNDIFSYNVNLRNIKNITSFFNIFIVAKDLKYKYKKYYYLNYIKYEYKFDWVKITIIFTNIIIIFGIILNIFQILNIKKNNKKKDNIPLDDF